MFSYRHGFHAGNHADVLKHICQMMLIEKLKQKNKPFIVFDTHGGGGYYDLSSDEAQKTAEFETGIERLKTMSHTNVHIDAYRNLVGEYTAEGQYPGSPRISFDLLRDQDKLCLMEWHNQEILNLKRNMPRDPRVAIHHRDGYEGLLAMLPPTPSRGMVLIDPPYELAEDYQKVVDTLTKANKKWPTGVYALWYPLLGKQRDKSTVMLEKLAQQAFPSVLKVEMEVSPQQEERGMHGSGMAIVNAPWQFDDDISQVLQELTPASEEGSGTGRCRVEWLVQPD